MISVPLSPAPLMVSLIAFILGVIALQTCATLPANPGAIALPAMILWAGTLILGFRISNRWQHLLLLVMIGSGFTSGFGYAAWRAASRVADQLPIHEERQDIQIIGIIDELPTVDENGVRFSFTVTETRTPEATVPSRLALTWFRHSYDQKTTYAIPELHTGARWQLTVRLKRPHGNANPGGFDSESWMLQHGWRATGYVRESSQNQQLADFVPSPMTYLQRLRASLRNRIVATLGERRYTGVIVALAIGEQRAIPKEQWQVFNRTGITHLVSISGLHVTLFSLWIGGLLLWLFKRLPFLTVPAIKPAVIGGFLASAFYVALSGGGIPAQRTLIMLGVAAFALWTQRLNQPWRTWIWALALVVLWDPWAPLAPGFWLSFGAVGWLLYAAAGRLNRGAPETIRQRGWYAMLETTRTQWIVTLGLTPLLVPVFEQFSLVSFPANLWAIPWITCLVVPLTLAGMIPGLSFLWLPAYTLIEILMDGLTLLSGLPFAVWQQHQPPLWTVALAVAGILWLLAPRGFPGRPLGVIWCLPLFLLVPPPPKPGEFEVTVLDVGQGLAVLIRTHRHNLLYDTGPRYSDKTDAGQSIVIPFLRAQAINTLDALVVSHNDNDHAGGVRSLLSEYELTPAQQYVSEASLVQPEALRCQADQAWGWDGVRFRFLAPDAVLPTSTRNDRSCVLKVESDNGSLLLTGDIGTAVEKQLIEKYQTTLFSDIIVAPHHGSRHSSSQVFVNTVSPVHTIFSVGYRNSFGFPRPETVRRYENVGATIWRTDQMGAVRIQVTGDGLKAQAYRNARARYWRQESGIR